MKWFQVTIDMILVLSFISSKCLVFISLDPIFYPPTRLPPPPPLDSSAIQTKPVDGKDSCNITQPNAQNNRMTFARHPLNTQNILQVPPGFSLSPFPPPTPPLSAAPSTSPNPPFWGCVSVCPLKRSSALS